MPSGFYRTTNDLVGKDPQKAIDFVTGAAHQDRLKVNLLEALYYKGQGDGGIYMPNDDERAFAWPNLCDRLAWGGKGVALLMNGTTAELVKMLRYARVEGLEGFWSSGDCLLVWYLRRKTRIDETKSLVLIAPQFNFLGANYDDPVQNYNYKTNSDGWRFMGVSKREGGLSLSWLINVGLPQGEGKGAWW